MDPLSLILGGAQVAGFVLDLIGQAHTTKSEAEAYRLKASELEELSRKGGYYDEVIRALKVQLEDIAADQDAAATTLALTEAELTGALAHSRVAEEAAVGGLEGAIKASAVREKVEVAQQTVAGLEAGQAGAQAAGQVKARAGAGNVGGQSVLRQAGSVLRQAGRRVALANLGISAARDIGGIEREGFAEEIGVVRSAGEMERLRLTNDITRAQLLYANTLRDLNIDRLRNIAQLTMTTFTKASGLRHAAFARREADYLDPLATAAAEEPAGQQEYVEEVWLPQVETEPGWTSGAPGVGY